MKVQVITPTKPPMPAHDMQGVYRRLGLFVRALGALGGRVDIAHLARERDLADMPSAEAYTDLASRFWGMPVTITLLRRGARRHGFAAHYLRGILNAQDQYPLQPFAGRTQAAEVGRLLDETPDITFVHRLPAMCAVLRSGRRPARMFFDLDDVEHLVRLREAVQPPFWPGKLGYAAQVPALVVAEWSGAARSRRTFVCSEADGRHLRRFGMRRISTIPNAVEMPKAAAPPTSAPTLLFLGLCSYRPNFDAAERMATRIMPLVQRDFPQAQLLIAGAESDTLPSRQGSPPGVSYLGYVDDLAALYGRSRVVCCPIGLGGGTRIKLVEAASYGRPMVSTRIGAEGLDFDDETEILLRDSDEAFAVACVDLLRDEARCTALGAAARHKALALYDAGAVMTVIRRALTDA
jgi:glycosyltransferase involved in cell wall biosynthesis